MSGFNFLYANVVHTSEKVVLKNIMRYFERRTYIQKMIFWMGTSQKVVYKSAKTPTREATFWEKKKSIEFYVLNGRLACGGFFDRFIYFPSEFTF